MATKNKRGNPRSAREPGAPIVKIANGSILELYDKAPRGIVCPSFWNFKPFNGCNYDCSWCYLNGTFFRWKGLLAKSPHIKNQAEIMVDLRKGLDTIPGPKLFNCGELADGLLFEPLLIGKVIPLFAEKFNEAESRKAGSGHKLLILTKSCSERTICEAQARRSVIFSYSVNAAYVSDRWEIDAPHPWSRLAASRTAAEHGFETRLRIDPMVPVNHWRHGYHELCQKIMKINPNVSVITIGSLRALKSTVNACITMRKNREWIPYCMEDSPFGKKIPFDTRLEMYEYVITTLRKLGYEGKIGVCKETSAMWAQLKKDKVLGAVPNEVKCNCQI